MKKYTFNSVDYIKKRYAFSFYQHPKTTHTYLFDALIKRVILANYKRYHFFSAKKTKQYTFAATKQVSGVVQYPLQADLTRLVAGNIKYYPFQVAKPYKRYAFATKKTNYAVSYAFEGELKQRIPNNPKLYPFIATKPSKQYAFESHYTRYNATYAFEIELIAFENGTYKQYTFTSHSERSTKHYAFESRKITRSIQYTFYLTTTEIFDAEIIRPDMHTQQVMLIETMPQVTDCMYAPVALDVSMQQNEMLNTYAELEVIDDTQVIYAPENFLESDSTASEVQMNFDIFDVEARHLQSMYDEDEIYSADIKRGTPLSLIAPMHETNDALGNIREVLLEITCDMHDLQTMHDEPDIYDSHIASDYSAMLQTTVNDAVVINAVTAQNDVINEVNSHINESMHDVTITTYDAAVIKREESLVVNVTQSSIEGTGSFNELANTYEITSDDAAFSHEVIWQSDLTNEQTNIQEIKMFESRKVTPDKVQPKKEDVYDASVTEWQGIKDMGETAIIRRIEPLLMKKHITETIVDYENIYSDDAIEVERTLAFESFEHAPEIFSAFEMHLDKHQLIERILKTTERVVDAFDYESTVEQSGECISYDSYSNDAKDIYTVDAHAQDVAFIAERIFGAAKKVFEVVGGFEKPIIEAIAQTIDAMAESNDAVTLEVSQTTNDKAMIAEVVSEATINKTAASSTKHAINGTILNEDALNGKGRIIESTHNGESMGSHFIYEGYYEQESLDISKEAAILTENIRDDAIDITPVHEATVDAETIKVTPVHEVSAECDDIAVTPVHEATDDIENISVTPVFETTQQVDNIDVTPVLDTEIDIESISITPVFDTEIDISAFEVTPTFDTNTVQVDPFRDPVPKIRKRMWLHQNRPQWAMKYFTQVRR